MIRTKHNMDTENEPVCSVDELGNRTWLLNGRVHRTDGPAIIGPSGNKHWFLNGKRHRTDGPAVEDVDGHKEWYINGELIDPVVFWVTTKERQNKQKG